METTLEAKILQIESCLAKFLITPNDQRERNVQELKSLCLSEYGLVNN
jgi:hypothetical protein